MGEVCIAEEKTCDSGQMAQVTLLMAPDSGNILGKEQRAWRVAVNPV